MLKRQISRYGISLVYITILVVLAAGTGTYILAHQHLTTPLQSRYAVRAEFSGTPGLTPGLGQPANVAGVRVGSITGTTLLNGRSVVTVEIDPGKLRHVFRDARVTLVPRTPLKDLQIEIYPGHRRSGVLPDGGTIPISQTIPPIDSDELMAALDGDTRAYFGLLVGGFDAGTRGRGADLRRLLRTLEPTTQQVREIAAALAARRVELRRLVHSLAVVTRAVGRHDRQLGQVVDTANATLAAISSQDGALRASIARLPGTLDAARRTLHHTTAFANRLGPTLTALQPTARALPATLRSARPLITASTPILRTRLRPLVRSFQPLVRGRGITARKLIALTPAVTSVYQVFEYLANELAYNPPGDDEGYLFWFAWFAHNANSVLSTEDANGAVFRGLGLISCKSIIDQPTLAPLLQAVLGPLPVC